MTMVDIAPEAATEFAAEDVEAASSLADWLAGEVNRLCAEAGKQICLRRFDTGIQTEFTQQDAVLTQLKASRAMARLIDLLQVRLLLEGQTLRLSNPEMAAALGLKSGEAVRQKLLRAVAGANRLAE